MCLLSRHSGSWKAGSLYISSSSGIGNQHISSAQGERKTERDPANLPGAEKTGRL